MFAKIFALLAMLVVVAFAAPNPKPQYLTYSPDYVYPAADVVPSIYSAYGAPLAYSALPNYADAVFLK